MPPTFERMLMALSLSTTTIGSPLCPAFESPLVGEPAGERPVAYDDGDVIVVPSLVRARAMPSATATLFEACPAMKASASLSAGLGKPETPPLWRSLAKPSMRPVSSLCV